MEEETVEDEDEDEWYDYGDGERNGKGRARLGSAEEKSRLREKRLPVFFHHDRFDRHIRIPVSCLARNFLSGEVSSCENVVVLCGTFLNHRDQLHFLPNPEWQDDGSVG